jgi:CRISPR-associated endonuclease/helicase Cas3
VLWLVEPGADDAGLPDFGRADTHVYEEYVLLRSYLALRGRGTIHIPEEVEEIIEAVYSDQTPVPTDQLALAGRLAETRAGFEQTRDEEQHEAAARWIPRPSYTGPLTTFTGSDLAEDEPGFHKAFQALTRLAETSVNVVLLWGSSAGPTLTPGGPVVSLTAMPSVPLARDLLRRSLSLSDRRVVYDLLGQPVPAGWRKSPLLRQHRLLALNPAGCVTVGTHTIRLDPDLGVLVE